MDTDSYLKYLYSYIYKDNVIFIPFFFSFYELSHFITNTSSIQHSNKLELQHSRQSLTRYKQQHTHSKAD